MLSLPLIRYVLSAASRDRLILSCLGLIILGSALAICVGGAALVEKQQFVVVYAAGGLRLLCVVAVVLFVSFFIQRSFDHRDVEFLLSRPLSRETYILSHAGAIVVIAAVIAAASGLALSIMAINLASPAYLFWTISLFLEIAMMGFTTLFFAMVLPSATVSALMTLAFYVLARMMGQLLGIVQQQVALIHSEIVDNAIYLVSFLTPRFDLMTQTSWLIYGPQGHESLLFLAAQGGAFSFLVLTAAVFDLVRREF